jgi:hemerythrin
MNFLTNALSDALETVKALFPFSKPIVVRTPSFYAEKVTWLREFECGIKDIDDYHKKLFWWVNQLFDHVGKNQDEARYFDEVRDWLAQTVVDHFRIEEDYMKSVDYPSFDPHKIEHDLFVMSFRDTVELFVSTGTVDVLALARFLKSWLFHHVENFDVPMFEYFKDHAPSRLS